jgi:hypothetical protein
MIRRSWVLLSKAGRTRTVVRDPRKAAKKVVSARNDNSDVAVAHQRSLTEEDNSDLPAKENHHQSSSLLPFQPSHQNQESIGSSLASYGLAGVGVAMGVTFVSALFGGL